MKPATRAASASVYATTSQTLSSTKKKSSVRAATHHHRVQNGAGAVPIKTEKGWIHLAHGVRNTAAGLRYVLYVFVTDLQDPAKLIAEPGGFFIAPLGKERVGDVSNVVFTNGAIADDDGKVYVYYASSDTRMHVAETSIAQLLDYAFGTPAEPAAFRRLRPPALCPHREKSRIYESAQIISLKA